MSRRCRTGFGLSEEVKIVNVKEAVKQLESILEYTSDQIVEEDPDDIWSKDKEALELAIKILKEKK